MDFYFLHLLDLLVDCGVLLSFRVTKDKIFITIKK